jgi:hypothetical protein
LAIYRNITEFTLSAQPPYAYRIAAGLPLIRKLPDEAGPADARDPVTESAVTDLTSFKMKEK